MKSAIEETERRRTAQGLYNEEHGIMPTTIVRAIMNINPASRDDRLLQRAQAAEGRARRGALAEPDIHERLAAMRLEMFSAAENLDFEKAARLRDELKKLEALAGVDAAPKSDAAASDPYAASPKRKPSGMRGKGTAKAAGPQRNGRRYKAR